ncbi:MAG: gamma-glutamylcyclotransferase family protein [Pseudomonadota bacterium]
MARSNYPVFVYGTLKANFPNAHKNPGKRQPGRFQTVDPYPLVILGARKSPAMLDACGQGQRVFGEVYIVDDEGLAKLDLLERVNQQDGYHRSAIEVVQQPDNNKLTAFAFLKPLNQELDHNHCLTEYSWQHAQLYVPRGAL